MLIDDWKEMVFVENRLGGKRITKKCVGIYTAIKERLLRKFRFVMRS